MAAHFARGEDRILLQVKPENADADSAPVHALNLTGDQSIPSSTYAKLIVNTAASLGRQDEKPFFKNQAQTHIAKALDAFHESGADVTW